MEPRQLTRELSGSDEAVQSRLGHFNPMKFARQVGLAY